MMNEQKVKELESELTDIETDIESINEKLKGRKKDFDRKLEELREEITRKEEQMEMSLDGSGDGVTPVEPVESPAPAAGAEVHEAKVLPLPQRKPLELPENVSSGS